MKQKAVSSKSKIRFLQRRLASSENAIKDLLSKNEHHIKRIKFLNKTMCEMKAMVKSNARGLFSGHVLEEIDKGIRNARMQGKPPTDILLPQEISGKVLQMLGEHPHFDGVHCHFVRELKPHTFILYCGQKRLFPDSQGLSCT